MQDYYEILGVPHFCDSQEQLRRAYKEQVLFFHPDKGNVNASIALERTQLLNEAYKTLKDPEKRASYDEELKAFLQQESYAAKKQEEAKAREEEQKQAEEKKKAEAEKQTASPKPEPKPASKPVPAKANPFLESIKKAADRAINLAPTLPKPILAGLLIVALLVGISLLDLVYRGLSGITSPKEIDPEIFASSDLERELHQAYIRFAGYRDRFGATCDFLESEDAGYGSSLFYASEKLIVMNRDDEPRTLTLFIDYPGSLGITLAQDTDAATIRFTENIWYGRSTDLLVIPEHPGTTVFTFSNDRSSTSFRVKVIVF